MGKETQNTSQTHDAAAAITVSHLLHPTWHFNHPKDVLSAEHLDTQQKRAILASWASDQYAVESIPALRHYPGTESAVTYDDVVSALKALDGAGAPDCKTPDGNPAQRGRLDLRCFLPMRRRLRIAKSRA